MNCFNTQNLDVPVDVDFMIVISTVLCNGCGSMYVAQTVNLLSKVSVLTIFCSNKYVD